MIIDRLIYKEYHMNIFEVIKKLQQVNASQHEIKIVIDALKCVKNPLEVFPYIFRYYRYPDRMKAGDVDNLLSKWLFCLSGTEFYQSADNFIKVWFSCSKDVIGGLLCAIKELLKNGNPSDPDERDKILMHAIIEYLMNPGIAKSDN